MCFFDSTGEPRPLRRCAAANSKFSLHDHPCTGAVKRVFPTAEYRQGSGHRSDLIDHVKHRISAGAPVDDVSIHDSVERQHIGDAGSGRSRTLGIATVRNHLRQTLFLRAGASHLGVDDPEGGWPPCTRRNCLSTFSEDGTGTGWVCREGSRELPTGACPWRARR
jgi:hypothetical protein